MEDKRFSCDGNAMADQFTGLVPIVSCLFLALLYLQNDTNFQEGRISVLRITLLGLHASISSRVLRLPIPTRLADVVKRVR